MISRSLFLCFAAMSLLAGCEGTGAGRGLFGTPSNNIISSIKLVLPLQPSRTAGAGVYQLQVNAYDRYGNVITVPYNENVTLNSNGQCEVGFNFYANTSTSTASPPPYYATLSTNDPTQTIAIGFNPSCGPNPVTVTASAVGVPSVSVSF